jgi:hypothetical protein
MADKRVDPHIGLTAASGIAYDQIAEHPRAFYDATHLTDVLNAVARALSQVAPIYVTDPETRDRRRLRDADLFGARFCRGASVLVLADGRSFTGLTILRSDLRPAISILRATGLKAFASTPTAGPTAKPTRL